MQLAIGMLPSSLPVWLVLDIMYIQTSLCVLMMSYVCLECLSLRQEEREGQARKRRKTDRQANIRKINRKQLHFLLYPVQAFWF